MCKLFLSLSVRGGVWGGEGVRQACRNEESRELSFSFCAPRGYWRVWVCVGECLGWGGREAREKLRSRRTLRRRRIPTTPWANTHPSPPFLPPAFPPFVDQTFHCVARGLHVDCAATFFLLSSRLSGAGTPLDAGLPLLLPSFSPPPALHTLVCTRLQRGETNASFLTVRPSSADMLRQEAWPLGPSNPPSQLSPPRPRPHGPRAAGGVSTLLPPSTREVVECVCVCGGWWS